MTNRRFRSASHSHESRRARIHLLTDAFRHRIVTLMERAWTPPVRWVFLAATVLGLFSTLQAYRLTMLSMKDGRQHRGRPFARSSTWSFWYVPALLTSPIFPAVAPIPDRARALGQADSDPHGRGTCPFSFVHLACMLVVRSMFWPDGGKSPSVP